MTIPKTFTVLHGNIKSAKYFARHKEMAAMCNIRDHQWL